MNKILKEQQTPEYIVEDTIKALQKLKPKTITVSVDLRNGNRPFQDPFKELIEFVNNLTNQVESNNVQDEQVEVYDNSVRAEANANRK